jgi:two-component system, OmpR family, osmolarity sensor histidine kinase EnvZ
MRSNWLPRSLFGRALLILLTPVVLAQLVATYIFFDRHWDNLVSRLAYGVSGDIALAVEFINRYDGQPGRMRDLLAQIERHTDLKLTLNLEAPAEQDANTHGMVNATLFRHLSGRFAEDTFTIIDDAAERSLKIRRVLVKTDLGWLQVEIPQRRLESATASVFLLWMIGSAVVFFAIATLFLRNQIRPIRRLSDVAERFGKGQDAPGFKPEGATEVRRAAQAFLLMRERIKRQIRQRTEMLAGVSHDLRTPLTRMKLQLALMRAKGIEELQEDVHEMERMVEGYLAFARGEGDEASEYLDLTDLIEGIITNHQRGGEREIKATLPPQYRFEVRPQAMRRCVGNLIGNALRYGKKVAVTLEETESLLFIHVDDDGPGIPADKRKDVLRPFVRLEESRNPETGGVGLGLTIARDIARGHGGDLVLADSPMGGLRASIRLPR